MASSFERSMSRVSKEILDGLQTAAVGKATGKVIGRTTVRMMKDRIKRGIATLRGAGKLKTYRKSYIDQIKGKLTFRMINGKPVPFSLDPSRVPSGGKLKKRKKKNKISESALARIKRMAEANKAKFGGKKPAPVNLRLTGKFLNDLRFKFGRKTGSTLVGVFTTESANKEIGHREGHNNQKERPVIPFGTKRFTRDIEQNIIRIYETEIRKKLAKIKVK